MSALVRWFGERRGLSVVALLVICAIGVFSLSRLPIDAVPDVTNNQVQVVTAAPALGATEVERVVTLPVERGMAGLPGLREVRSVSKLGISVVTLVFRDEVELYFARAQVGERLVSIREEIPPEVGRPELGPVATALGEIYQFELVGPGRTREELRTLLEWTIAPKLRQLRGVTEVVAMGGERRQFRVTLDSARLAAHAVSLDEVKAALERDNANAGGGSIERSGEQLVLRAEARFKNLHDIAACVVRTEGGAPLTVGMLGDVDTGAALRQGAMSADGKGETVGGSVLMLKGENSREVVHRVEVTVESLNAKALPAGVKIVPYLNRAEFIERTVATVAKNLIEGAIVVILVLLLTLGSLRAGLIVAGAIPFAMLCAFSGLVATGMSANVMSLGAVDFGIIVEGAVVVTEAALHAAVGARRVEDPKKRRAAILRAAAETARPVLVSVVIVLLVFLPLATLEDVEGKMFRPVVVSLVFMLMGAIFWALVVVPSLAPAALERFANEREPLLVRGLRAAYEPLLARALRWPRLTIAAALAIAALAALPALKTGAEFLPRIFEGSFAIDARRPVSVGLNLAVGLSTEAERALLEVPEVARVVSRTGRPEDSVDPQGPEGTDVFVILAPRADWRRGLTPEALVEELDKKLERRVPGTMFAFSQPIEMRVNDLIAGVKSDVAVKLFGDDLATMSEAAEKIRRALHETPGSADVKMEVPTGLPTVRVVVDRDRASRVAVSPRSILSAVAAARAGEHLGHVYEGERIFDLVLKVGGDELRGAEGLRRLPIPTANGELVPLETVAKVWVERDVVQIGREGYRRRLIVESNVRGRDLVGFVADAKSRVAKLELPRGVEVRWGGQFENFTRAKTRLTMLVPVALGIIAVVLFAGYRSVALTIVTMTSLVFALAGGALGLGVRGMPFSIPAAVGFIALAGVAVMSGVVMTTRLLQERGDDLRARVERAARHAFRPTISTALVAALGFLPMAVATSAGAEVQRPLATVVIAGLLVGVVLASIAMPAMLRLVIAHVRVDAAEQTAPPRASAAGKRAALRKAPKRRLSPTPAQ